MSETGTPSEKPVKNAAAPAGNAGTAVAATWGQVWQVPALMAGLAAIGWAGWYAAKTTPQIDRGGGLVVAAGQVEKGAYEGALGTLNELVLPYLAKAELTQEQEREFFLLRARAVFLGQRDLGFSRKVNNENIVAEYGRAEKLGAVLGTSDVVYRIHTLIDLGEFDSALRGLEGLGGSDGEAKTAALVLRKRLIDAALEEGPARGEAAVALLSEFTQEAGVSDADRLWALDRQSRLLIQQGYAEEAITRILRAMPRLENAGGAKSAVGEVVVTLGEAYLAVGQVQRAGEQLGRAERMLGEAHPLAARVARLLGYVDQQAGGGRLTFAREQYARVLELWPTSEEVGRALLGLAEVESGLSNLESAGLLRESIEHYGDVVGLVEANEDGGERRVAAEDAGAKAGKHGAEHDAQHDAKPETKPETKHDAEQAGKDGGHTKTQEKGEHGAQGTDIKQTARGEHGKEASQSGADGGEEAGGTVKPYMSAKVVDVKQLAQDATTSLMSRFAEQFDKAAYEEALEFATLTKRLAGVDAAPPDLLLGLARTHREIAGAMLSGEVKARESAGAREGERDGEQERGGGPGDENTHAGSSGTPEGGGDKEQGAMGGRASHAGAAADEKGGGGSRGTGGRARSGAEVLTLSQLDPATQREAREHLLRGGEYYRMHAARVVQTDVRAYGDSLWNAADMFDAAGDLGSSALAFEQFAADFPGDSRKPAAMFRFAEAQRARGDVELAAKVYQELIASRGERDAGPLADASFVPLAKTLLLDAKPENDGQAEELLLRVTRGEVGGTGTGHFRDALRALGEYYYDTGKYERAIEKLTEYLEREQTDVGAREASGPAGQGAPAANGLASIEADGGQGAAGEEGGQGAATFGKNGGAGGGGAGQRGELLGLLYKLADAQRLSAGTIAGGMGVAMPDTQRRELEDAKRNRLLTAGALFERVARAYGQVSKRTGLDDLRLRNAVFYRADCAFDLRDFDSAIRLYDEAKERYPRDPASLVAMVQIVACLVEQGKTAEAVTANTRAKRFYESLPQSAFDDPSLPMNRKQWEQWLDVQTKLAGTGE